MKLKKSLFLCAFCALATSSFAQSKYQSGIGIYPFSFYAYGENIRYNYLLTKKNHMFYLGLSTHINKDIDKWSNTQSSSHNNGATTNLIHYFHPNIGYSKFFNLNKNYPVSFLLNFDLMIGKINFNDKLYTYAGGPFSTRDIHATFNSGVLYWFTQFTINMGLKVKLNSNFNLLGKGGVGAARLNYKMEGGYTEFPVTYSLGLNYVFNNKK